MLGKILQLTKWVGTSSKLNKTIALNLHLLSVSVIKPEGGNIRPAGHINIKFVYE